MNKLHFFTVLSFLLMNVLQINSQEIQSICKQSKSENYFFSDINYPNNILMDLASKSIVQEYKNALDSVRQFAESNKSDRDIKIIDDAKKTFFPDNKPLPNNNDNNGLMILEEKNLTDNTLEALKTDIQFLDEYKKTGNSKYLEASINDVAEIKLANQNIGTTEQKATITVEVKSDDNKVCKGFKVMWKWSAYRDTGWEADFDKVSTSSKSFALKRKVIFWAVNSGNLSDNGSKTETYTDIDKTINVGKPSNSKCYTKR